MTRFSPSESALQGFKLIRARPGSILIWSLIQFLGMMVMFLIMAMGLGPSFIAFVKQGRMASADMSTYTSVLEHSWPAFVLVMLMAIALSSILTGGIYRMVLFPHDKGGFAHLRLGADEFRLIAANIILFSIGTLAMVVVAAFAAAVGGPLGIVLGFVLAALVIWIGVRLLLATPMTFAEHRISIIASWRLTRGHFWSLLGMTLLAIVFWLMVWLVVTIVGGISIALAGGQDAIADPVHLAPFALLAFAVNLLVQLLLPTLQVVMIYSPLAEAYRELHDAAAEKATASLHPAPGTP